VMRNRETKHAILVRMMGKIAHENCAGELTWGGGKWLGWMGEMEADSRLARVHTAQYKNPLRAVE
jgi:hypothetical protein